MIVRMGWFDDIVDAVGGAVKGVVAAPFDLADEVVTRTVQTGGKIIGGVGKLGAGAIGVQANLATQGVQSLKSVIGSARGAQQQQAALATSPLVDPLTGLPVSSSSSSSSTPLIVGGLLIAGLVVVLLTRRPSAAPAVAA